MQREVFLSLDCIGSVWTVVTDIMEVVVNYIAKYYSVKRKCRFHVINVHNQYKLKSVSLHLTNIKYRQ